MLIFGRKTQERKMTDHIKKNKDIKDKGRQRTGEREEKKENTCISFLIFLIIILFQEVVFDINFKSDLFIICKFCF